MWAWAAAREQSTAAATAGRTVPGTFAARYGAAATLRRLSGRGRSGGGGCGGGRRTPLYCIYKRPRCIVFINNIIDNNKSNKHDTNCTSCKNWTIARYRVPVPVYPGTRVPGYPYNIMLLIQLSNTIVNCTTHTTAILILILIM